MHKWLSSGGLAAVFSRDLSWVKPGSEVDKLLTDKATHQELILFVSKHTEITKRLRAEGGVVHTYPSHYSPSSRFTIIDYKKNGARIAVGANEDGKHTIRKYSLGSSPTTLEGVIIDLVHLAELTTKKVRNDD
jgi:hypothetical protein